MAGKDAKLLKDIAKTIDDAAFAITDELTVFKELGFEGSESIVILKKVNYIKKISEETLN